MFRVIFAFLLSTGVASAATYYVPDDYPTIQGAINACVDGDVVIVRPGVYVENIDFIGKAIHLKSESGPDITTIDGNQTGSVVVFQTGEGLNSVVDGFTLTNGTGTYIEYDPGHWAYCGGGIFCNSSSPTIMANIISGNAVDCAGGGISCWNHSFPVIKSNTITGNKADSFDFGRGGGISCDSSSPTITENTIAENTASCYFDGDGGGIWCSDSSPTITNNAISGNSALGIFSSGGGIVFEESDPLITNNAISGNEGRYGGGICCSGPSSSDIKNNTILGNMSELGGGIFCWGSPSPTITNNTVRGNMASDGGGIFCRSSSPTITNNAIRENTADYGGGGGVYCEGSSSTITNNTISGNSASDRGGGIYCVWSSPTTTNTILWENSAPTGKEIWLGDTSSPSTLTISYSDIEGGLSSCHVEPNCTLNWGAGMIDADPLFADADNGDFHLTWQSPCKNTGDNTAVTEIYDFEGDPRIWDGTVDMGADEFHTHLYHMGDVIPGSPIDVKVVGTPTAPVTLALGAGIVDPPRVTPYGDLFLAFPLMQFKIGSIPSNGVLVRPSTVPLFWNPGDEKPLQALVGPLGNPNSVLTNLLTLTVE